MRIFSNENSPQKLITIFYFAIAMVEVVAEFFLFKPILFFVKPLVLVMIMVLYWYSSTRRNPLFFLLFFFMLLTKIYIIFDSEEMLFLAMMVFILHRLVMIYYIAKIIQLKNYIPLLITVVPFLFFFLYLLSLTEDITARSYNALILQSILIAVLASMTISHYTMNNDKKGSWLLIFGLISVVQYFIVFIDRFYLEDFSVIIFKPLLVILTTSACYTFYKFVITAEKLDNN